MKYTIGIDEVGRGSLAGPVSLGGFLIFPNKTTLIKKTAKNKNLKFADSKKLSTTQRESWLSHLEKMQKEKNCVFFVTHKSSKKIDKLGLTKSINEAIVELIENLNVKPNQTKVLLDGGLRAPAIFTNQKTIIKGDEKEFSIMCASIVAKVTRDRYMQKMAKKYPEYGLENHVGYGTREHIKNIKKHGKSPIHRTSFLRKIET